MSTETTNKKIKIDNGTTFGRTYTDKAVDELLKNVGRGLPELVLTINSEGNITVNTTDIKDGVYSLTINAGGTLVKNYGLGNICTTPEGTEVFSGYLGEVANVFSIELQETNIISPYNVPLMAGGMLSNSLPYFNNSNKLECLLSPGVDYNFLSYDTKSKKYLWLPLTAGVQIIRLFNKHPILVPKDSADTSIIPCTTADNGKVLSVVNGEAQWASVGGGGGSVPDNVVLYGELTPVA